MSVTLATLPPSIPYSRALPDSTPLAGWTGLVPGWWNRAGERGRRLPTSLQQACNLLATCLQLLPHSSATTVLPRVDARATLAFLQPKGRAPAPAGLRLAWSYRQETPGDSVEICFRIRALSTKLRSLMICWRTPSGSSLGLTAHRSWLAAWARQACRRGPGIEPPSSQANQTAI